MERKTKALIWWYFSSWGKKVVGNLTEKLEVCSSSSNRHFLRHRSSKISPWYRSNPIFLFETYYRFFAWADFSKSLKTDCREFRSPVCRVERLTPDWGVDAAWGLPLPANHSVTMPFLWRLKRGGGWHPGGSPSFWILPWPIENLILLRLPSRGSGLLRPYCVFVASHIFLVSKLCFFLGGGTP